MCYPLSMTIFPPNGLSFFIKNLIVRSILSRSTFDIIVTSSMINTVAFRNNRAFVLSAEILHKLSGSIPGTIPNLRCIVIPFGNNCAATPLCQNQKITNNKLVPKMHYIDTNNLSLRTQHVINL